MNNKKHPAEIIADAINELKKRNLALEKKVNEMSGMIKLLITELPISAENKHRFIEHFNTIEEGKDIIGFP